ncbi:MAG: PhoH family protein [Spirochaetaceae bacterium]|nr:MAG: PhoH family protein [Spirochaetaceae bacterium]
MGQNTTVVLADHNVVGELCGANDRNIAYLESLLQSRVTTRGNEIYLSDSDPEKQRIFSEVLRRLEQHLYAGITVSIDLIQSVYRTVTDNDTLGADMLLEQRIELPGVGRSISPRSHAQACYIRSLQTKEMVFCIGPAGTGKTYLAVAAALHDILTRKKRKLVLTRPVVEAGENLGFLPGDLAQKINPYLRPLYDAIEDLSSGEMLHKLESNNMIEIAPLAYMRGRSLKDCVILLDEAQNTTKEQMKMFLTRIGEGSRAFITGDVTQIDLPRKSSSGLLHAVRLLNAIEELDINFLSGKDVVRSAIVQKIVAAYEADTEQP